MANIYEQMFRMDLSMLNLRRDWNKAYWNFVDKMKEYVVNDEKDWKVYLKEKEELLRNAWSTFNNNYTEKCC